MDNFNFNFDFNQSIKNYLILIKRIIIIYHGGSGRAYNTIMRKSECEELGLEANTKAVLEDVGHNADLYIANQEDNTQN